MRRATRRSLLAAALVLVAGCDALDGPPPIEVATATVTQLEVEPGAVSVDTLAVVDGRISIPLSLSARVEQGDFAIRHLRYALQWQFTCVAGRLEADGVMEDLGGGIFARQLPLEVPPGRRGKYRLTVWAVDAAGRAGNEASTTFDLRGTNLGPPVITAIEAPAEIRAPTTLRFVVRVDDPDGIDHIARAEVDVPFAGTLPLADTDTAGNNVPCDGTYSVAFTVPTGVEPGPVAFTFRAFDRAGAVSEEAVFTVQILPR